MLIACSVLAVHQAYTERYGRNRRLWGAYRAEHLCAKYDHILQAAGFRLESEIYNDLARWERRSRGLHERGADQIRERLAEEAGESDGDGDGDEQSEASGEEGAAEGAGEAGAKGD
eukprot:tig00021535_g22230.t1